MNETSARRAAQRRLAKEIKTGTFKPSGVGAKAREAAKKLRADKSELVAEIRRYKNEIYSGSRKFNQKRSDQTVRINPVSGKERGVDELRQVVEVLRQISKEKDQDRFYWAWNELFDDEEYVSAFFYH